MTSIPESSLALELDGRNTPPADIALACKLFDELEQRTSNAFGFTRPSFGLGEQIAHDMVRREAKKLGLETTVDAGCNLYMTLRGRQQGPGLMIGSHLDSVPRGGNFDGAAGVLMGLAVLSGFVKAGITPERDITVMAIRAEESVWFGASYVGSRMAFGKLDGDELASLKRSSDGVTLLSAIDANGGDARAIANGDAYLSARNVGMFIEPHIEQGPVLVDRGIPVGIVTGIRGSFRYRAAHCHGEYGHSGATPRDCRADAVRAVATLVVHLDEAWIELSKQGRDLVVTFSQFSTNPDEAAFSKIAGEVDFSLDVRSEEPETLDLMLKILHEKVEEIEKAQNVRFDLGSISTSSPAKMAPEIVSQLERCAEDLDFQSLTMPCGAGHDAAIFAASGVPTGMIFIRNEHGSHNPEEHMEMADFSLATNLLSSFCLKYPLEEI
ncbi:hydantoinase/carbamoylase family amidase [uncultured Cohaesibacter sp.]|uniref:hydantoinase/carbamoylase family amidase n=1 Tax=uncultured Cohaesibacter sp. TaxID=1002546 RepID=UPI0029C6FF9A|nr:hydantoinase/carbamoylase family amidase [uncultured Cohaesibacter sp.]